MRQTSTISSKGQVPIPIVVRRRLGLDEGARVEFVEQHGETVLRPVRTIDDPFAEFIGVLAGKLPSTIEEIVRQERIERGSDPEPAGRKGRRRR